MINRLVFSMLLFVSFAMISCKEQNKPIPQTKVSFKKEGDLTIYKSDKTQVHLDIEIADTDFDIQTGLMYRDGMKKNQGMLFVFNDESERFFYMKNTKFPLDLIYINADKHIVSFQKNAKPFDESSLPSNVPAQYVLEMNAGLIDIWNLKVGDSISFKKNN
ncbi:DUF192 domain-containing protein [Tamlana fucoidanivorans]|uniref:DUF192 domain-containing protein n=1 Tax=Allotamlana fucoidanivorans TaxID=2583814 RepID=A0A5C4SPE2_9FLAO|nr:DUF192 domain-containing protein [Tamlana fucoidanivorans]TNJ46132.1 DUF192 domain-containing protein [Tamlana fucoidanivorans]